MNAPHQPVSVLLVEDDPNLGAVLQEFLELKSYNVTLVTDGDAALDSIQSGTYDICVLDVMLPKRSGFEVAREVRRFNQEMPIIYLTARGKIEDKAEGYAAGGDDYLTKPFSMDELLLRMQAVLRRSVSSTHGGYTGEALFTFGGFTFNYPTRALVLAGKENVLTSREADLLFLLVQHLGSVVRREDALKQIWGDDSYFNARSMDVFISKLRKYLNDDPRVRLMNVHGVGYKLLVA